MPPRRYTILVVDRTSGVIRRATLSAWPLATVAALVLTVPVLVGLGAAWKGRAETGDLQARYETLEIENANYRQATEALAGQIESLQSAINDLGVQSRLDPSLARSMDRLPALVKARAMGGGAPGLPRDHDLSYTKALSALMSPEDTFGMLRTLLDGLQSRLDVVARTVERRNALADATPSMWPAIGWLSSAMGARRDPITGSTDYHKGLDIAGERGQPVYATAAGTVRQAGYQGAYGNLIVIDHGFGLQSRYGHLLRTLVKHGARVERGDIIGQVGATGRATGYHLHYEVTANGRLINPLQLLTQRPQGR